MDRWSAYVLALGLAGMAGFVGSLALAAAGLVATGGLVSLVCLSLGAYAACLVLGHLGDLVEFRRRYLCEALALPQVTPASPGGTDVFLVTSAVTSVPQVTPTALGRVDISPATSEARALRSIRTV